MNAAGIFDACARLDALAQSDRERGAVDTVSGWFLGGPAPSYEDCALVSEMLMTVISYGLAERMVEKRLEGLDGPLVDFGGGEWSDAAYLAGADLLDLLAECCGSLAGGGELPIVKFDSEVAA